MNTEEVKRLARKIVRDSLKVEPGERVLVDVLGKADDLVEAIVEELYAVPAIPFLRVMTIEQLKSLLIGCTKEQLNAWVKQDLYRFKTMEACINIRSDENIFELSDIDPERYDLYLKQVAYPIHAAFAAIPKYVILKYPTYGLAQLARMSLGQFTSRYMESCTMDYSLMAKRAEPLGALLSRTDKVRVVSPGTDLRFSVKDMPNYFCDGRYNLPDGELFTAPVLDSVEGVITFNVPTLNLGLTFEHIRLRLEKGTIVEAACNDTERLRLILGGDEGASRFGEFGIGLNPYIVQPYNNLLFDEKMAGSVHFAIGHALEMADNGNRSAVHWDMVLSQLEEHGGGELYFDDVLVRKNGLFVPEELQPLNPPGRSLSPESP
ncbi:aminopeptidase [Paenibacillus chitinolyticus]